MKIVLLMSTYNGEKFLPRALRSAEAVLAGTDWVLVAGCDGCTDKSYEVIKDFKLACRYKSLISYSKAPSVAEAKNRVVRQAQQFLTPDSYVLWLDDDDQLLRSLLSHFLPILKKSDALYIAGDAIYINDYATAKHSARCKPFDLCFSPPCSVARAELYKGKQNFFLETISGLDDTPTWVHLAYKHDIWPLFTGEAGILSLHDKKNSVTRVNGVCDYRLIAQCLAASQRNSCTEPASISTVVSGNFHPTFKTFLSTVRRFHPTTPVYVLADKPPEVIDPNLVVFLDPKLAKKDFHHTMEVKFDIAATACYTSGSTWLLDSDVTLLAPQYVPFDGEHIAMIPEGTVQFSSNQYGQYNAGMVFYPSLAAVREVAGIYESQLKTAQFGEQRAYEQTSKLKLLNPLIHNIGFRQGKPFNFSVENQTLWFRDFYPVRSLHYHADPVTRGTYTHEDDFRNALTPHLSKLGTVLPT